MQLQLLTFPAELNIGLQVGDIVYYSPTLPSSNFNTINSVGTIVTFGVVTNIYREASVVPLIAANSILVSYDEITTPPPLSTDYIMFNKNKQANSSSLTGYYADVEFENHSTGKIELFAIGSEVSESSK